MSLEDLPLGVKGCLDGSLLASTGWGRKGGDAPLSTPYMFEGCRKGSGVFRGRGRPGHTWSG